MSISGWAHTRASHRCRTFVALRNGRYELFNCPLAITDIAMKRIFHRTSSIVCATFYFLPSIAPENKILDEKFAAAWSSNRGGERGK